MENYIDNNFGVFVLNRINELNEIVAKTMSENGKNDDEIEQYFESEEYGKLYIETCNMLINDLTVSLNEYILEDDETERKERDFYLEHLQSTWGMGLAWMRQYYLKCADICEGWGWYINQSPVVSDKCNIFNTLKAIHGKALLVYAEIICLLENGFPDGAYAHYRILYELWAVAEFLYEDSDETSVAFVKSFDDKSDSETSHYKWAKASTRFPEKEKDITISNIVTEAHKTFTNGLKQAVSNTHLKKLYTFPNKIIHPSAKGVFGRTSKPADDVTLIGRADTGIATPAINSSMTMFNITCLLLSMVANSASAIGIRILDNIIGQKIVPLFQEMEKKQDEEMEK